MKQFLYRILHGFTGCLEKDMEWQSNKVAICQKCRRIFYGFRIVLPEDRE